MRRTWTTALGVLGAALLLSPTAKAADHLDGASVMADPATDITDVYAWMSADASKIYLALNVFPLADKATSKFSTTAKYAIHLTTFDKFGPTGQVHGAADIICTFDATQKASCWLVDKLQSNKVLEYVTGDASATAGLDTADQKMKVFAGPRDDPFFFNLEGFKDAVGTVTQLKQALTFDTHGCPTLTQQESQAGVAMLSHTKMGTMPPADFFKGLNVLSIVVALDKTLVSDATHPIVTVYASTHK